MAFRPPWSPAWPGGSFRPAEDALCLACHFGANSGVCDAVLGVELAEKPKELQPSETLPCSLVEETRHATRAGYAANFCENLLVESGSDAFHL